MSKNYFQQFKLQKQFSIQGKNIFETLTPMCEALNFKPEYIIQVGASISEAQADEHKLFIESKKTLLFEPNPKEFERVRNVYGEYPNIVIYNIGIYKYADKLKFYGLGGTTYLSEIKESPVKVIDGYAEQENQVFWANCATIDGFDDGNIDLLLIDCEGSEWFVLEKLKSRPVLISLETHSPSGKYLNPFIKEIYNWMKENNYIPFAFNESDTVFANTSVLQVTKNSLDL